MGWLTQQNRVGSPSNSSATNFRVISPVAWSSADCVVSGLAFGSHSENMGYVCCVPKCKSGYSSAKHKVALFRFLKESGLRRKWIVEIPKKSWVLSSNHRVCAKHFASDDFVRESAICELDVQESVIRLNLKDCTQD